MVQIPTSHFLCLGCMLLDHSNRVFMLGRDQRKEINLVESGMASEKSAECPCLLGNKK